MTTIDQPFAGSGGITSILDRERIIATAGFNRWLVPPAALCIHLCIGMAYGFSVFWLPLSRAIGLTASKACPDMSIFAGILYDDMRLEGRQPRLDVHAVLRRSRRFRSDVGWMA